MIKSGTLWTIEIAIDNSSEIVKAETKKEIEDFIENLTGFQYFELNINKINGDKTYRLRSVNDERIN